MTPRDWIEFQYGNVMDVVASCIRAGITAPPGKDLVVCDYGSIESRIVGWLSGCVRMNQIFAEGKDTYKDFAQELFHCDYDEVTKEQRDWSKPPFLGCVYQLGADGLVGYADGYGVKMARREAQHAVTLIRTLYPEIPAMWTWLVDACKDTVRHNRENAGYRVRIHRDHQFLMITLPSGRTIYYFQPLVETTTVKIKNVETGEIREWETESVTYMGMNSFTHKWDRISSHGGKFTEQICQAIGVEILKDGLMKSEEEVLLELVGHVHDEGVSLADSANSKAALKAIRQSMIRMPPWADGLLMGAEGYTAKRYRK